MGVIKVVYQYNFNERFKLFQYCLKYFIGILLLKKNTIEWWKHICLINTMAARSVSLVPSPGTLFVTRQDWRAGDEEVYDSLHAIDPCNSDAQTSCIMHLSPKYLKSKYLKKIWNN